MTPSAPTSSLGHAVLLDRPLSARMGGAVIDYLSQFCELPESGCLAGQSVMSALMALYPGPAHVGLSDPGQESALRAPIRDVDVFHGAQDRLLEDGWLEEAKPGGTGPWAPIKVVTDVYERACNKILNVAGVRVQGMLNLIELAPGTISGFNPATSSDQDRLDTVLAEFDLSLVQVGVDLKSGEMRWRPAFEGVVRGEPVSAQDIGMPERTWMRYQSKRAQMPWLSWDEEQIKSATQLAQMFIYALQSEHPDFKEKMNLWASMNSVANIDLLDAPSRLSPIWSWNPSPSRSAAIAELERKTARGELVLSTKDQVHFDVFKDHFACVRDESPFGFQLPDMDSAADCLSLMIQSGTVAQLRLYLRTGGCLLDKASISEEQSGRRSKLMFKAIAANRSDMVNLLLDEGFSPNERMTPDGPTAYLDLWRQRTTKRTTDPMTENAQVFERMRQLGADVTLEMGDASTVLHEAAKSIGKRAFEMEMIHHEQHRDLTDRVGRKLTEDRQLMSDEDDETDFSGVNQHTALLINGCRSGEMNDVLKALRQGASVDMGVGVAPIFEAAYHGHPSVCQALLNAGANGSYKEQDGKTALMSATELSHSSVYQKVMQVLLEEGVPVDDRNKHGETALVLAATRGKLAAVHMLLASGARSDVVLRNGRRLIEVVASNEDEVSPRILVSLAQSLEETLTSSALEAVLGRSKEYSQPDCPNNTAAIDSILARLYIERIEKLLVLPTSSVSPGN